jgi:hypothetical protein
MFLVAVGEGIRQLADVTTVMVMVTVVVMVIVMVMMVTVGETIRQLSDVTTMLLRRYGGVTVVLQWCRSEYHASYGSRRENPPPGRCNYSVRE